MSSMLGDHLFVYGTLRRAARHPYAELLRRHADYQGLAFFQGQLFLLNGYPGAVSSDNPADQVRGDLYLLHDASYLLERFDDYEECSICYPQPTEYVRRQVQVNPQTGQAPRTSWIYLYNRPTKNLPRISSGDFLQHHLEGSC